MALLLRNGAVFLHIPKTGGNWVRGVLEKLDLIEGEIGHKHSDVDRVLFEPYFNTGWLVRLKQQYRKQCPIFDPPFLFCFVRHPLSWYESWFKYMSQPKRNWRDWPRRKGPLDWHPNAPINGTGDKGFNRFVQNVMEYFPGYVTQLYGWYTKRGVDFVGHQESLREDMVELLQRLDVEFDPNFVLGYRPVGVSPEPDNPVRWDSEVRTEAIRTEYAGILQYGYSVEEYRCIDSRAV